MCSNRYQRKVGNAHCTLYKPLTVPVLHLKTFLDVRILRPAYFQSFAAIYRAVINLWNEQCCNFIHCCSKSWSIDIFWLSISLQENKINKVAQILRSTEIYNNELTKHVFKMTKEVLMVYVTRDHVCLSNDDVNTHQKQKNIVRIRFYKSANNNRTQSTEEPGCGVRILKSWLVKILVDFVVLL